VNTRSTGASMKMLRETAIMLTPPFQTETAVQVP
jgi:hypothetical protein